MHRRVGKYRVGSRWVELFLVDGLDGRFATAPPSGITLIEIGSEGQWHETVSTLIHESTELALLDCQARFAPSPDYANSNDGYLFVCDHLTFGEATARVGIFVAACLPDMLKTYKQLKAGPRRRKSRRRSG